MPKYTKIYTPLVKQKGFSPSPVAGRIPPFADSEANSSVRGTRLFTEWWDEQIDRCVHGYRTGGYDITGRHYFYLNFVPIDGLFGKQYPWFVDLDYEVFKNIDIVKTDHMMGLIVLKARRKGLSEKVQGGILHYGLRFIEGYRGAITAGLETYVKGLRAKFMKTAAGIHKEMRLNVLIDNDEEYKIGYERKDSVGGWITDGYMGHISFRTMYDNPKKLEGEYFHDVICEESGEFLKLYDTIDSIMPALEFGSEMLGNFYIIGTGGNILTSSKDFSELYNNAEQYNLLRMFVSGSRLYFPFFVNKLRTTARDKDTGVEIDGIPNLSNAGFKPYQMPGMEDVIAAESHILYKRKIFASLPDKTKLKKLNKNYCLTEEEAFTSGGRNDFNDEILYNTLYNLEVEGLKYKPYILEWAIEEVEGVLKQKQPPEVSCRPAKESDPSWKIVWIYQMPRKDYADLDVMGIDSYNQDQTRTSYSLGATVVVRRGNWLNLIEEGIHNAEYPICLYYQRPPRKEIFYDISLMIAIMYGCKRNVMINAEQDFCIDYFKKNGGMAYLSRRPKKFDAPNSRQVHEYGAKMTGSSKPVILAVLQTFIEDFGMYIVFPPMLRDLIAYDEEFIGTDWDSADALAYAKMRIEDMKGSPRNVAKTDQLDEAPIWVPDRDGNMILKNAERLERKQPKIQKEEGDGGWKGFR